MAYEDYFDARMLADGLQPTSQQGGPPTASPLQPQAPQSPQQLQERRTIWGQFFQKLRDDPNFAMKLGALGMGLTMPARNVAGQLGQGFAMMAGAGANQKLAQVKEQQAQLEAQRQQEMLDLDRRRVAVEEGELEAKKQQGYFRKTTAGGSKEVEKLNVLGKHLRALNPEKYQDEASAYVAALQLYQMGSYEEAKRDLLINNPEYSLATPTERAAIDAELRALYGKGSGSAPSEDAREIGGWTVRQVR